MPPSHNDCGCSAAWRRPKPNGTCGACGGWLPGEQPILPWLGTLMDAPNVEEAESSTVNTRSPFGV